MVLELKKPDGNARFSLLQAYAYAVAFDEAQRLNTPTSPNFRQSLRELLGYLRPRPKLIRFAAYAVVDEKDIAKAYGSEQTKEVLKEAGDDVLLGVLGYKLEPDGIRLTHAQHWVDGHWKDVLEDSPEDRRLVPLTS